MSDRRVCKLCEKSVLNSPVCPDCLANMFPWFWSQLIGDQFLVWKHVLGVGYWDRVFKTPRPYWAKWLGHGGLGFKMEEVTRSWGLSSFHFSPIGAFVEAKIYSIRHIPPRNDQAILACLVPVDRWFFGDDMVIVVGQSSRIIAVHKFDVESWIEQLPISESRTSMGILSYVPNYDHPQFGRYPIN